MSQKSIKETIIQHIIRHDEADMETPQHGNVSKNSHKTNLMSSSLNIKLKRLYSKYKEFKCKNRNCSCNLKIL